MKRGLLISRVLSQEDAPRDYATNIMIAKQRVSPFVSLLILVTDFIRGLGFLFHFVRIVTAFCFVLHRSGTVWENCRAAYEDIVKHLER